ncbi:ATP-binding protein [uncultured Draconibacterium sp.]|uniref:ATP-binding protein n=1 Tax=uncultured Draconibacterium sp. TaxID=1573823 RepID=UPI0025D7ADA1|nr:ATP-binding protein [uncultured Draconibacterium sp.]
MIQRDIGNKILEIKDKMPVICVTGPRQSGKTTLVKYLFPDYKYYNLEFPEHRQFAQTDAIAFLANIEQGIIIDEIQRVPELLSSIQYFVDERKLNGRIIITGSQNILLMQSVSQTLAGRVALFTLLPFSFSELEGTNFEEKEFESYMVKSFFPRIYDENLDVNTWLQDYTNTYIERDVRQITAVKDLSLFTKFLQLCAGHTGQIINFSSFSNNLGVDVKTVKAWMSVLETSFIVFLQQPYYRNFNKRVIKSPRLFFYDTGLACNLLGINKKEDLLSHYLRGGLFESFIISELHKTIFNQKNNGKIYFFRDSNGNEIDALIEMEGQLKTIEIKSGKTIIPDFFKSFHYFNKLFSELNTQNFLVYGGGDFQQRTAATVVGWKYLNRIFE